MDRKEYKIVQEVDGRGDVRYRAQFRDGYTTGWYLNQNEALRAANQRLADEASSTSLPSYGLVCHPGGFYQVVFEDGGRTGLLPDAVRALTAVVNTEAMRLDGEGRHAAALRLRLSGMLGVTASVLDDVIAEVLDQCVRAVDSSDLPDRGRIVDVIRARLIDGRDQ